MSILTTFGVRRDMVDADRLRSLMEAKGISQSELARRVGVSQSAIHKLTSGTGQGSKHLHWIARELGTTPEYLNGETDEVDGSKVMAVRVPFRPAPQPANDNVEVHEIDLAYGMGGTYLDHVPLTGQTRSFPLAWLRIFTDAKPEFLFFARGHGDSMMPTISDGDVVLIDRSQTSIRVRDKLWAVAIGEVGMIKRIRPQGDGSVEILSDNPLVPVDRAYDGEMHVIGRVVSITSRV